MLRSGKVIDAQKRLLEFNQIELYEWVSGGAPAFDNASFVESDDFGDFIPNEFGSSSQANLTSSKADTFEANAFSGNRTNLLFVESSHALIRENKRLIESND